MVNDVTREKYKYLLKRLREATGETDVFKADKMIKGVEELRKADGTELGATSRRNYLIALASMTQIVPAISKRYKEAYRKINADLKRAPAPASPPPMSWDEYQAIGLALMDEAEVPLEDRILIGFVTQIVPTRLDIAHLKVFPAVPKSYDGNYLKLGKTAKTSKLVIQKHKTARTYGALRRDIPDALFKLLKQWRTEKPEGDLFEMSENVLGKRISKLFKVHTDTHTTMNTLRHAYVTQARKGDRSKTDVEKIAHELGHSLAMNYDYRRDE
jgi:hypothetical protein